MLDVAVGRHLVDPDPRRGAPRVGERDGLDGVGGLPRVILPLLLRSFLRRRCRAAAGDALSSSLASRLFIIIIIIIIILVGDARHQARGPGPLERAHPQPAQRPRHGAVARDDLSRFLQPHAHREAVGPLEDDAAREGPREEEPAPGRGRGRRLRRGDGRRRPRGQGRSGRRRRGRSGSGGSLELKRGKRRARRRRARRRRRRRRKLLHCSLLSSSFLEQLQVLRRAVDRVEQRQRVSGRPRGLAPARGLRRRGAVDVVEERELGVVRGGGERGIFGGG